MPTSRGHWSAEDVRHLLATGRLSPEDRQALEEVLEDTPGENKFGAKPVTINGIRFDSSKEGRRYVDLQLLEQAGEIENLRVQVPYDLHVEGVKLGVYVADFVYFDVERGEEVVEDTKSPPTRTALYRWKARHMAAEYDIEILET